MTGPPKEVEAGAPHHQDRPSTKLSTHDSADNLNATGNATSTALSANAARVLTDRIKVGVEAVWELVKQAYEQRAWNALGYTSWDDYCTREFGATRLRLPREERAEVVASLRESGLSIRAIASATGDHYSTISRELGRVANATPGPEPECDGKCATDECVGPEESPSADLDDFAKANEAYPQPRQITGIDGKRYEPKPSQPQAQKPRRKPITDQFRRAVYDLKKAAERIHRLTADDRFDRNRQELVTQNLNDLLQVVNDLDDDLWHLSHHDRAASEPDEPSLDDPEIVRRLVRGDVG
ncbi:helix-turn-helix domain-containing protein [Mycobacterium servetii]|uniref:Helix-turn-helix domain-containing protein n=1 Tax=Mycobacterium servetii TaxID=3237418 RepID=A0ABV4BU58_9MYCO